ncbi:MAG: tRNA preQ1(34) S-adenosylmethionine ribosyltransferase-isomerase QueA [Candidatus Omnitrophica bacterium]|nr:tRNA preQ1(34) S-adenosylmethionine ribosyltransferase-isomerase QueA [Candidatus Omnitrophota bacterium]
MLTYDLPKELIAQRPCEPRDSARLLVLDRSTGRMDHRLFQDLPAFLHPGDCLILNDTKVLLARLYGKRADTGGKVELLILRQSLPPTRSGAQDERGCVYRCLGQPGKRLRPGTKLLFDHGSIRGEVVASEAGEKQVRFEGKTDQIFSQLGEIPLPPYIRRPVEPRDAEWYQTVFAREPGAVAAPTAGLHFTEELLDRIRAAGVRVAFVTLHVGWGTFKPVGEKEIQDGRLHEEWFRVPPETIEAIEETKKKGGRVIAVGTTVVRTLETFALRQAQGERTIEGTTDLFIRPGFEFRVVDAMVTNFHLPGTSLLLLVAAFAGEEKILSAYQEAVRQKYRFYSYGDAMFIQ